MGSKDTDPGAGAQSAAMWYPYELQTYLQFMPLIAKKESQLQPELNAVQNQNWSATRSATMGDVSRLAPKVMQTLRNYNPQMTGLLDTLESQAQAQLNLNGALDPATQRLLQQNIRTSQAARGMGNGPGDAAQEAFYQAQTQEQRRLQNQNLAMQVASQSANTYRDPFSWILQMNTNTNVTPQIVPSSTTDSMFGMQANAGWASNTAAANRNAATESSLMQTLGSMAGGMAQGGGAAAGGGACCFIFLEAYHGTLPPCIRRIRDKYYRKHPRIARGYTRMARWLVPWMQRSRVVRGLVWHGMVRPATSYAGELRAGWRKQVSHAWLRAWAMMGS